MSLLALELRRRRVDLAGVADVAGPVGCPGCPACLGLGLGGLGDRGGGLGRGDGLGGGVEVAPVVVCLGGGGSGKCVRGRLGGGYDDGGEELESEYKWI